MIVRARRADALKNMTTVHTMKCEEDSHQTFLQALTTTRSTFTFRDDDNENKDSETRSAVLMQPRVPESSAHLNFSCKQLQSTGSFLPSFTGLDLKSTSPRTKMSGQKVQQKTSGQFLALGRKNRTRNRGNPIVAGARTRILRAGGSLQCGWSRYLRGGSGRLGGGSSCSVRAPVSPPRARLEFLCAQEAASNPRRSKDPEQLARAVVSACGFTQKRSLPCVEILNEICALPL